MNGLLVLAPLIDLGAITYAVLGVVAPEQLKKPARAPQSAKEGSGQRKRYRRRYRTDPHPDRYALLGESNYSPTYHEDVYGE